jgi:hypothetical protein
MATTVMERTAIEQKIKMAIEDIGEINLEEKNDTLLNMIDEIALEMMLRESEEQDEKGLNISAKELKEQIENEMRNGTYG